MRHNSEIFVAVLSATSCIVGCYGPNPKAEPFGKIYYLDGAGNLGFGTRTVRAGLQAAGYEGDVEVYGWTSSFNPLLDQLDILGTARAAGKRLADRIKKYKQRYPNEAVNIIALSAGTGVAVWACEELDDGYKIDNLVLLGSSLSHDYDMTRALRNIQKTVYVYHSERDAVLRAVEVVGTIDRKIGVKSAGQVGLKVLASASNKISNISWSDDWQELGWSGGHTDCTSQQFVRGEIAQRVLRSELSEATSVARAANPSG